MFQMNSTTTTAIPPLYITCQSGLLNESEFKTSDELMLEELERRDGIYSFIFHELEAPKPTTRTLETQTLQNGFKSENRSSTPSKMYAKKYELLTELKADTTSTTKTMSATMTTTTKTFTTLSGNGVAHTNAPPTSSPIVTSTTSESCIKFPACNQFSRYQQYLKTWYPPATTPKTHLIKTSTTLTGPPPFYLDKHRPSNLYAYMLHGSVSVRPQPPRFSHISEPLVRNRRHALKETEAYTQYNNTHTTGAPDLRALFPHDPDVHAPFLKATKKAVTCAIIAAKLKERENE